jgi:molybdate transport system substrate-binding protein
MTLRTATVAVVLAALTWGLAGCGNGSEDSLVVSAAASVGPALEVVADAFEEAAGDVDVVINVGGSTVLRDQVVAGSPVDLLIVADERLLAPVVDAGMAVSDARLVASNELALLVPAGNPGGIGSLSDLADSSLAVGLCAEGVPCGDLAAEALTAAGVVASVDTFEPNAGALVAKVSAGELDAALAYRSDVVRAAGAVEEVELPPEARLATRYGSLVTAPPERVASAEAFLEFLVSDDGRSVLSEFGFGVP